MPFNEKGEFIRANPVPSPTTNAKARASASARRTISSRPVVRSSGRARITNGAATPPRRAVRRAQPSTFWEDLRTIVLALLALALLAGMVWVVVMFHKWIMIGLTLLAISSLQKWLK